MEIELDVSSAGVELPALLALPAGPVDRVLVTLHPASDGSRRQPHFDHLAATLPSLGTAVLRYDRRASPEGQGVPFDAQLEDAAAAVAVARRECGDVPVGLWGFSQGAWIAVVAATTLPIDLLVLVAFCAVTPAAQMRFGTAEHARRAGCDARELAELDALRATWEGFQRGVVPRAELQRQLDGAATTRWFEFAWVPRLAPSEPTWSDMDFDPSDGMRQLTCPTLAFYGARDEWVPFEACVAAWDELDLAAGQLELHVLDGLGHDLMEATDGRDVPSPRYEAPLHHWLGQRRRD